MGITAREGVYGSQELCGRVADGSAEVEVCVWGFEDKDPSILWVQSLCDMMFRWLSQLSQAERWMITDVSSEDVVRVYRCLVDNALPKCLMSGRTTVSIVNVPYAYPSTKLNCHKNKMV